MRHLLALALVAGCSGPAGPTKIVDNAVLAAVSPDQKYLAHYTAYSQLADGATVGTLTVMQTKPGADAQLVPLKLDDNAFGATFNRAGKALFYQTGQTASTDAGATTIYGALHVWAPGLTAGVKLTSGLAVAHAEPPDHSFTIYWDAPNPTRAQTGAVVLARAADCAGAACKPVTLANDVTLTNLAASTDGRYAAYQVKMGSGIGAMYDTHLVSVADGKDTKVSSSASAIGFTPLALSPDGQLLATCTNGGLAFQQLQVVSTSTGMPVAWAAQPQGTGAIELAFADPTTVVMRARDLQSDRGLWKMTASAAVQLAPTAPGPFFVQHSPAGASRYLWVAGAPLGTPGTIQLYDLQAAMPAPVLVAMSTTLFPLVADDLSKARLFDKYDPSAKTGTLTLVALPSGTLTTVEAGIGNTDATFSEGGGELLFRDGTDGTAGDLNFWKIVAGEALMGGAKTLVEHGVYDWRERSMPDTLYFAVTNPDTTASPPRTTAIYSVPLPTM